VQRLRDQVAYPLVSEAVGLEAKRLYEKNIMLVLVLHWFLGHHLLASKLDVPSDPAQQFS